MIKRLFSILICAVIFVSPITVQAADLPIDITAIGRQDTRTTHITTRVGANLFTRDSQVVNELLTERIRQRQAVAAYLFESVSYNYEIDPHARLLNTANYLALFAQPSINTFTSPQSDEDIPLWIMALVLAACAVGGFIWALTSNAKKRRKSQDVY